MSRPNPYKSLIAEILARLERQITESDAALPSLEEGQKVITDPVILAQIKARIAVLVSLRMEARELVALIKGRLEEINPEESNG